jgi:CBS domain-containing protein
MLVSEILRRKGHDVATVSPDATVASAVEVLRRWGVGALVVAEDEMHVVGIVSERDIVRALGPGPETGVLSQPVSRIMTTEVLTCCPTDRVGQLMVLMTDNRVRHLPVVVDGHLQGIVSIGDVVKSRLSELEDETRALEDYIHHGR